METLADEIYSPRKEVREVSDKPMNSVSSKAEHCDASERCEQTQEKPQNTRCVGEAHIVLALPGLNFCFKINFFFFLTEKMMSRRRLRREKKYNRNSFGYRIQASILDIPELRPEIKKGKQSN